MEVNGSKISRVPLCLACECGHLACVCALPKHRSVAVNMHDDSLCTPLYYATLNNHSECVQALLEYNNIYINPHNYHTENPFPIALGYNHAECISCFLRYFYSSSPSSQFPLQSAVLNGHVNRVSALLSDSTVDVNTADENTFTPLSIAVIMNKPEIIKLLLKHEHIQVNKQYLAGYTLLAFCSSFQECSMYKGINAT